MIRVMEDYKIISERALIHEEEGKHQSTIHDYHIQIKKIRIMWQLIIIQ